MCDDSNTVCNLGLTNAVNVRLHQSASDLLALVLWLHGKRVDGNGAASLFVTNGLSVLERPALALPVCGKSHGAISHRRL